MTHRMKLKVVEGDALHLTIGGVIVDPILVAAEAIARMKHRRMLVGDPRQLVEPAAGKRAEAVEMGFKLAEVPWRQIVFQQVAQTAIDGVEILPRAIRRDVIGAASRLGGATGPGGLQPERRGARALPAVWPTRFSAVWRRRRICATRRPAVCRIWTRGNPGRAVWST